MAFSRAEETMRTLTSLALATALTLTLTTATTACAPAPGPDNSDDGDGDGPSTPSDKDGDGHDTPEDCNDNSASIHPGASETCNGIDEDCNNRIDDPFDADNDNFATCFGDCDDSNPAVRPGALETNNGIDDNCNGMVDEDPQGTDDDGDGFTELMGDCNDMEPLVNPDSVEVKTKEDGTPEGVDNDCNMMIDEDPVPCDTGLGNPNDAMAYAKAIGLCKHVVSATWKNVAAPAGHELPTAFGVVKPKEGTAMAALASGPAKAPMSAIALPLDLFKTMPHPAPMAGGCGPGMDPATVQDFVELELKIKVPRNAKSFSYNFNFMTHEFPEWVCQEYDDTFLALLDSQAFKGNISFDAMGKPVTVNVGFFTECQGAPQCTSTALLAGTGMENGQGGGTAWLTTTSPVTPGETVTLRFVIFDEGDGSYDSIVLIDNFRWLGSPVDGPVTIP